MSSFDTFTVTEHANMITNYLYSVIYKDRVPNEEDGCVVSNQVPVSLLCVELDSKATRVTNRVSTARLTTCWACVCVCAVCMCVCVCVCVCVYVCVCKGHLSNHDAV